jgi:hypothetical protein
VNEFVKISNRNTKDFFFLYGNDFVKIIIYITDSVRTGSGVYPVSYPVDTRSYFPKDKTAGM